MRNDESSDPIGKTPRYNQWLQLQTQTSPSNHPATMQTYYYVLTSQNFLDQEPIAEVFKERTRYYHEQEKDIDFWLVPQPAFLDAPEMAAIKAKCPQPASAIISTNPQFITWLKLRLEFVITGEFQAPSDTIAQPLASLSPTV